MRLSARKRTSSFALACSMIAGSVLFFGSLFAVAQEKIVPDFSLLDVNTTSSSYDQLVSPRDFLQQVSGWYFADAT